MSRAASQASEEELVTVYFIRNNYEKKYNSLYIPFAIKLLMVKFVKRIIGCNLLTMKQDLDFYQKIYNIIPFKINKFILRFRASKYNYSAQKFHEICDNNDIPFANICFIKSKIGNIFGGFTTSAWGKNMNSSDEYAFLFMINSNNDILNKDCPLIFNKKQNVTTSIVYNENSGPVYGNGFDCHIGNFCDTQKEITFSEEWDDGDDYDDFVDDEPIFLSVNWSTLQNYENNKYKEINNLCGIDDSMKKNGISCAFNDKRELVLHNFFDVVEYEVFEVQP